jgi:hydroxymethylpyrimidine/phosphomethylpyrimidine kinase
MISCLTIAGFDNSGGAGMQADLKTFAAFGCYGTCVLTALPVQNTYEVKSCYTLPITCLEEQLEIVFNDIPPHSIKIGMLFNAEIIQTIAAFLRRRAQGIPIILDPVMVSKSQARLLQIDAITAFKEQLLPLADLLTPNLPESHELVGDSEDMVELCHEILALGAKAVLLKGGHQNDISSSDDLYMDREGKKFWMTSPRIDSKNTHGTGCTLSSAITACLALGQDMETACRTAKRYLYNAMLHSKNYSVGHGNGPVHHFYHVWPTIQNI